MPHSTEYVYNSCFIEILDFSVSDWLNKNVDGAIDKVEGVFRDKLLNDLGLTKYLMVNECSVNRANAAETDCAADTTLPSLPKIMTCVLGENCLTISCCVLVPIIQKTFTLKFELNTCEFDLYTSIENLNNVNSLIAYPFGMYYTKLWFVKTAITEMVFRTLYTVLKIVERSVF
ncbi:hypothetical protein MAR_020499 [Mya arenaria]|uniref:Uncharacterized protein n=1 Tax=Mya arenaria TaxID=6604 RepID=A0ABY7E5L1_MYAAR|nr:hypothetical protein MAR_020499 [Mya arenaria]